MKLRFHHDPESSLPHIYDHGVTEEEVRQVLVSRGDDFQGRKNSRIRFGRTSAGRCIKVVYVPDLEGDGVLVITSYELRGNELKAFRRRRRRRRI